MRSFEERIVEISRRSDIIFEKRKKMRNRLLTACVTLVLCVGLWGVSREGINCTETPDSLETQIMENCGVVPESAAPSAVIEVSGEGIHTTLRDCTSVSRVLELLRQSSVKSESTCDQMPPDYAMGATTEDYGEHETRKYQILVTNHDGSQTAYTLEGSTLTNEQTKEQTLLQMECLEELKEILNLNP